ncbi:MAG: type II secretion system protein [Methylophilaceae bacterium]
MALLSLPGNRGNGHEQGFAYVALLCVLAGIVLMLGITTEQIEHAAQRDREEQLLFVGNQFRQAIASYYEKSPGAKQYPRKLEELLQDNRFPKPVRHLRRIYADPMRTGIVRADARDNRADWQLVRNSQGGIVGIYSRSSLPPIRTNLDEDLMKAIDEHPALHYSDWKFIYQPLDGSADLVRSGDDSNGFINDPDNPFGQVEGEAGQQDDADADSSSNASQDWTSGDEVSGESP